MSEVACPHVRIDRVLITSFDSFANAIAGSLNNGIACSASMKALGWYVGFQSRRGFRLSSNTYLEDMQFSIEDMDWERSTKSVQMRTESMNKHITGVHSNALFLQGAAQYVLQTIVNFIQGLSTQVDAKHQALTCQRSLDFIKKRILKGQMFSVTTFPVTKMRASTFTGIASNLESLSENTKVSYDRSDDSLSITTRFFPPVLVYMEGLVSEDAKIALANIQAAIYSTTLDANGGPKTPTQAWGDTAGPPHLSGLGMVMNAYVMGVSSIQKLESANMLRDRVKTFEPQPETLHIYHITRRKSGILVDQSLLYLKYVNILEADATKSLPGILDLAANHVVKGRVLIVCSSKKIVATPTASIINNGLKKFYSEFPKVSLYKLSIIHLTASPVSIIYNPGPRSSATDMHVRKISNVLEYRDDSLLNAWRTDMYDTSETTDNVGRHYSYKYKRVDETSSGDLQQIDGQWWYKMYTKAPLCADGRLTQITGTCWWNAAANIMLLTNSIAALLKMEWDKLKKANQFEIESIPLEMCPTVKKLDTKSFIFVLVNQILIQGQRSRKWQKNFVAHLAGDSKNASTGTTTYYDKHQEDLQRGDGRQDAVQYADGHEAAIFGLKTIMTALFELGPHYNTINITNKAQISTINLNNTLEWVTSDSTDMQSFEQGHKDKWDQFPYPLMVVLHTRNTQIDNCPIEINVNGQLYDLESGCMQVFREEKNIPDKPNHVVACLTCRSQQVTRYIFDSNNNIRFNNWMLLKRTNVQTDIPDVIKRKSSNREILALKSEFWQFEFLIYILRASSP